MRSEHSASQDEVEQILMLAVRKESAETDLRKRLLDSARELGISDEAALAAEKQWRADRRRKDELAEFRTHVRGEFQVHVGAYLAVNLALLAINLLSSNEHLWVIYPAVFWGLALAGHAFYALANLRKPKAGELERWRKQKLVRSEDEDDDEQPGSNVE